MKKMMVCALALLWAGPALAQVPLRNLPPETFKHLSAQEVEALTDKPGPGAKTAFPVDHENYYVEYAQRSDKGNKAEVHAHWTHYIHVISGEATLTYGGTLANPRETGPGQIRGEAITGGSSRTVKTGDFLQIPAGMPHLFQIAAGGKFRYVVFNGRH